MAAGTSLIASGAGATLETAIGIYEYYEGEKMRKKAEELERNTVRPIYTIPQSQQTYLSETQKRAMLGMDEQQRQRYIDQINRTAAYTLQAGARTGGGIQGVSGAQQNLNDANGNLLSMDNQQKQQNIQNYYNALQTNSGYEDKAFAYNLDQPYQDNAAAVRALKNASEQAKYAGAQTVANAGASFAGSAGQAINSIYTQPTQQTTSQIQPTIMAAPNSYYGSPSYGGQSVYGAPTQQQWESQNPYGVNPQSTQVNTGTTNAPTVSYGAPTQSEWEKNNPNYYYVR